MLKIMNVTLILSTLLLLVTIDVSPKEVYRNSLVDYLNNPLTVKKIENHTKILLFPDNKKNNHNENDRKTILDSPEPLMVSPRSTLTPITSIYPNNPTLPTTKNGKTENGSPSGFSDHNLKTIIILLLCILVALVVFVIVHFYITMRRTYTGVFIPRHNFVPANPFDASWIYEHIDCVPIIIQGGEKRGSTFPFFKTKHKRAIITHL